MLQKIFCLVCVLSMSLLLGCDGGCGRDDMDFDGIIDSEDNCPDIANPLQIESETFCDGYFCNPDGFGDPCDNCPGIYNPDQMDSDKDGIGDACDDASVSCLNNGDCFSANEYCAKEPGDCAGSGTCKAMPEMCPYFWAPVCGCDGKTYGNNCAASSAGTSVNYQGECITPEKCLNNSDCEAVNTYCSKEVGNCEATGICQQQPDACDDLWDPVCGCDYVTYSNSCAAAQSGVSIIYKGECCTMKECGPQSEAPNYICDDGITIAGPGPCLRNADGTCGFIFVTCP